MTTRTVARIAFVYAGIAALFLQTMNAQAPAAPAKPAAPKPAAATPPANLGQLMKGMIYPNSNVIFAAQGDNPAQVKPDKDPATSVNPLASAYGQWQAVENSGLAIAEAAALLLTPGRKCANGLAVPLRNPDWAKFVAEMKRAGMQSYEAAKAKDQDKILDAAGDLTTACSNCHDKYREKPNLADRCK